MSAVDPQSDPNAGEIMSLLKKSQRAGQPVVQISDEWERSEDASGIRQPTKTEKATHDLVVKKGISGWTIAKGVAALLLIGGIAAAAGTGHLSLDHKWGWITGGIIVGLPVVTLVAYHFGKKIQEYRERSAANAKIMGLQEQMEKERIHTEIVERAKANLTAHMLLKPEDSAFAFVDNTKAVREWEQRKWVLETLADMNPEPLKDPNPGLYARNKTAIKIVALFVVLALVGGILGYGFGNADWANTIANFSKHTWQDISDWFKGPVANWFNGPVADWFKGPVAHFFISLKDNVAHAVLNEQLEIGAVLGGATAVVLGSSALKDLLSKNRKDGEIVVKSQKSIRAPMTDLEREIGRGQSILEEAGPVRVKTLADYVQLVDEESELDDHELDDQILAEHSANALLMADYIPPPPPPDDIPPPPLLHPQMERPRVGARKKKPKPHRQFAAVPRPAVVSS